MRLLRLAAIVLTVTSPSTCDGESLKATVKRIETQARTDFVDADFVGYKLTVDLLVSNTSKTTAKIPVESGQAHSIERALTNGQEEKWQTRMHYSFFDTGDRKHPACFDLKPGESGLVRQVKTALFLKKEELPQKRTSKLTLRLNVGLPCVEEASGRRGLLGVQTEPFEVRLHD